MKDNFDNFPQFWYLLWHPVLVRLNTWCTPAERRRDGKNEEENIVFINIFPTVRNLLMWWRNVMRGKITRAEIFSIGYPFHTNRLIWISNVDTFDFCLIRFFFLFSDVWIPTNESSLTKWRTKSQISQLLIGCLGFCINHSDWLNFKNFPEYKRLK